MAAPKPAGGWIAGIVKEVPSGDTIRIASRPTLGAPEKRITLASLIAPRLGKRDGSVPDEDYAWESREFLRKLAIGKPCRFCIDYTLENIPGREFGRVNIGAKGEFNLAQIVAGEGWAKVRQGSGSQNPEIEQLVARSEQAEAQKKGLFQKDATKASRDTSELVAQDLLERVGKGKPLPAVVEQIGNGANLRVTLLEGLQPASVQLCGVVCPSVGRRPQEGSEDEAVPPQPFALEAKHFTEMAVLNREVRILLQGVDKHDNLIGSLMYPTVGQEGSTDLTDLGLQLVERGLGKIAEWGLQMMITGAQRLREAERKAKQSKAGQWHNYVPPASAGVKMSDDFTGTVVECVSGDVICVKDSATGVERRVTLSSIKAPRMGARGMNGEPWSREARELLRQKLIGKEVNVNMEYSRKVGGSGALQNGAPSSQPAAPERQMDFGSVHIKDKGTDKNQPKLTNVAGLLLARGLATVVKHRTDDERSAHYEALLEAEQAGIRNKNGLHKKQSDANGTGFHVNDISLPGNASKAKQHLSFLTRNKSTAVVEAVLSGNRLKLYIEKEGIMLAFSPSGVRAPQRPQPAGNGRPAVQGEPFWEEAYTFTRQNMLQREVEVEIETVDRGGSFLGTVVTKGSKPINLGLALLSNGLAKLHPSFDPSRVAGGRDLVAAEEKAKEKRLKVWQDYVPEEARPTANGDADDAAGPSTSGSVSVTVTEMADATSFYIQRTQEPRVEWITSELRSLDIGDSSAQPPKLKSGQLCLARFSLDKQLYRAKVEAADFSDPVCPQYLVTFIDFGNKEKVRATSVKEITPELQAVPPQSQAATLAYLKVKDLNDEVGNEAARLLAQLTGGGKTFSATVVRGKFNSAQPLEVILGEEGGDVADSVNAKLLKSGLARFAPLGKRQALDSTAEALQKIEEAARKGHEGMWQYGDPGDESDEEDIKPKNAWGRR